MTRTRPSIIVLLVVVGAGAGWLVETALVAMGRAIVVPPFTLAVALLLIAVIVVVMAWPVWRVVRGTATKRVDPFYATRVVVLAKASSMAGALLGGGAGAMLLFLLTRSIVPALGSIWMTAATAVCGVILLVAGLVAEKMCTLPPDDDDTGETALAPDPR